MEVNVNKIKSEIINLDKTIEEYENNYLSLYNELNSFSFNWKSDKSDIFFDKKQKEKISINDFIVEIKSYRDFFDYILRTYGTMGEKVFYDITSYNEAHTKLISFINDLKSVLEKLKQLKCKNPNSIVKVNQKIFKVSEYINELEMLNSRLNDIFKKIEEYEKDIKYRISKLSFMILNPSILD